MALSTLAGWTGSAIITKLVDVALSYLRERMLPADTEAELNRLKLALPKIQAVMNVSETLKFKHPNSGVVEWLNDFKLAFLAADDVLDELEYRELEKMVKKRDQVSAPPSSVVGSLAKPAFIKKKIVDPLKKKFRGSNLNSHTLKRLREAVKMLDQVVAQIGDFFQFVTALDGPLQLHYETDLISDRETSSFLTENEVFGRENEKARILEWLKKPMSQTKISALSIVGDGGLGKTTLAQLIFEDISREKQFDETIWVCVSTCFRVEDITRKILEHLGDRSIQIGESLNSLQLKLQKKVDSKKVFLILDDVWNDDKICDWQKLVAPLKFVQQGSKILLTTRMKSVAKMLDSVLNEQGECLEFRGLDEPELLQLFNKYAFHGCNPNSHKDLRKIANHIVKKLWGSPLAAKLIGSLLKSNMNFEYWRGILECDNLFNLDKAKNVADVLKLSYYHLSADLQECFRFCSIFPQDFEFEKSDLINMWMASGFIRKQTFGEGRPEDVGEEYLNCLISKSFFERDLWSENHYKMHDLMHELAQNVSKGQCFRVEENGNSADVPDTALHVSMPICEIKKVFHLKNLRSLVITRSEKEKFQDPRPFVLPNGSLKETLRVLRIDVTRRFQLPEEIERSIHLRYLVGTRNMESRSLLPNSIDKLYHLQVLKWWGTVSETTRMTNLIGLRDIRSDAANIKSIKGAHKLTSLEQLTFYVRQERGHHIDELKTLNNLRRLFVHQLENVSDPATAKNVQLSKKTSLTSLDLYWTSESNCDNPEQIIDNLQPSSSLRNLTIYCYKGGRSPTWLRDFTPLEYLSNLTLHNCSSWEDLPRLAQMPHLKRLHLRGLSEVKEVDYSVDNTRNTSAFPSLEYLWCEDMPKWQSWAGQHNSRGFPNLKYLSINNCPLLSDLPIMPLSLSRFDVQGVGINSLPDIYQDSSNNTPSSSFKSSLTVVLIKNCPNLKSLMNGFLHQDNIDLTGLVQLTIDACESIVQIPTGEFVKLESLEFLYISDTPKLVVVDNQSIILPVKLQTLYFGNCGELDLPLLKSASHLSALHALRIIGSPSISCIPFSENSFQSLGALYIRGCDKLIEHSAVEYAQDVNSENNMASLKIKRLEIPHLSLLSSEPLKSLRFVRVCHVNDCSGKEALPEPWLLQNSSTLEVLHIHKASSLRSLPDTMVRLTALQILEIENADLLEEIPELPTTIKDLRIHKTSSLKSLPSTMMRLTALQRLIIGDANLLEEIPELPTTLKQLYIRNASSLCSFSDTMARLTTLNELGIDANLLEEIPELPTTLEVLSIHKPCSLQPFSGKMMRLTTLRSLSIYDADLIEEISELPTTLEGLYIFGAKSLRSLPDTMMRLTVLGSLVITNADLLEEIPELPASLWFKGIKDSSGRRIV